MRKIVLTILFVFLFSGVALAGSSTYEGYPVINVKVDGQLVESDVPGIAINGTTLVPLRAISESMGADIAYDSKTKTAIITSKQGGVATNGEEIEKIQAYVRIADFYDQLDELGRSISGLANTFETVYNHYMLGTDPGVDIELAFEQFNDKVDRYNNYLELIPETIKDAKSYNIDVSDIDAIISSYSSSIDYFRESLMALENISSQYSKQDYNTYFTNGSTGMSYANDASLKAYKKYTYYINLAK